MWWVLLIPILFFRLSFVDQSQRESVSSVFRLLANAEAVDAI